MAHSEGQIVLPAPAVGMPATTGKGGMALNPPGSLVRPVVPSFPGFGYSPPRPGFGLAGAGPIHAWGFPAKGGPMFPMLGVVRGGVGGKPPGKTPCVIGPTKPCGRLGANGPVKTIPGPSGCPGPPLLHVP